MLKPSVLLAIAAVSAGGLTVAPATVAKKKPQPSPALKDCATDGDLDRVYTRPELSKALYQMPDDLYNYTECADVLRAAFAAGPSVRVVRRRALLHVRCAGRAYRARLSVRGGAAGSARVPVCRRGTRVVRIGMGRAGQLAARRHRHAVVTLTPNGETLRFLVRLRVRR